MFLLMDIMCITIEQCIAISRNVEHNLDREEEDFELQVSSPGLTESFKVFEQYKKYTGRNIENSYRRRRKTGRLAKSCRREWHYT